MKSYGYSIYLLSNIGTDYFNQLREMWESNIFKNFDGFYTTNPDHGYVKKPHPDIFDLYVFCTNFIFMFFNIIILVFMQLLIQIMIKLWFLLMIVRIM